MNIYCVKIRWLYDFGISFILIISKITRNVNFPWFTNAVVVWKFNLVDPIREMTCK